MTKLTTALGVGAASVALAAVVGAGIATADATPDPTPAPTSSPSADQSGAPAKKAHAGRLMRRALHGEVTLAGPKHKVVAFQRGSVVEVSDTAVTVRSNDGFTATYVINDATRTRKAKQPVELSEIAVSDTVRVRATVDGEAATAKVIAERKG